MKKQQGHEVVYLTQAQVKARYGGVSDMAIWRWEHRPEVSFPRPLVINGRKFWKLSELETFERRVVARGGVGATDPDRNTRAAARARAGKKKGRGEEDAA